ncbi:MAG: UTP--glucose-1-phosphate uridylyltransferase [Pseudomonadota bacterium]|jgi:UTP--glucose-1-phosphate uridylyltransferase|nr:UTP--glucose-1-phosphate uridylyltransferase [Alphaproteobacteria bacterium]
MIKTAVFPVAGLGSRFLPATKAIPKEMLVVVDKPLIQYAVEEAKAAGIEKFIFITSQGKEAIEDHFDSHSGLESILHARGKNEDLAKIRSIRIPEGQALFVRQHEPLGLGHAVWCARHFIQEDAFALLLADDLIQAKVPCLKQMVESYSKDDGNMVAVIDVPKNEVNRYGVLDIGSQTNAKVSAKAVVEKPDISVAPSTTAIIGRYILSTSIFEPLGFKKAGAGGEIQLTDGLQSMLKANTPLTGFRFQGERYDCGTKIGWLQANLALAASDPEVRPHLESVLPTLKMPLSA